MSEWDVVRELVDEAFAARRFAEEALASRESRRLDRRDADLPSDAEPSPVPNP